MPELRYATLGTSRFSEPATTMWLKCNVNSMQFGVPLSLPLWRDLTGRTLRNPAYSFSSLMLTPVLFLTDRPFP